MSWKEAQVEFLGCVSTHRRRAGAVLVDSVHPASQSAHLRRLPAAIPTVRVVKGRGEMFQVQFEQCVSLVVLWPRGRLGTEEAYLSGLWH